MWTSFLNKNTALVVFLSSLFFIFSCKQIDVYEKNTVFHKHEFHCKDTVQGSFVIADTNAYYNLYIIVRHTDQYKYNNIWLNVGLKPPTDTFSFQRLQLTLGDDANGWEGTGMNDIWEARKLINGIPRRFKRPGKYEYCLVNIMRDDPLLHVMSIGLRMERVSR